MTNPMRPPITPLLKAPDIDASSSAGSTEGLALTGCSGHLDRVQHAMAPDRVVEGGAEKCSLSIVARLRSSLRAASESVEVSPLTLRLSRVGHDPAAADVFQRNEVDQEKRRKWISEKRPLKDNRAESRQCQ
jgi:hypothetical protein